MIPTDTRQIEQTCAELISPIRISALLPSGYPLICSLWYEYTNSAFFCVTQENAKMVEILQSNSKCAFELSPNKPPYFGLRGYGEAEIYPNGAVELLEKLIVKYLGSTDSTLAQKLLSNSSTEVIIKVQPKSLFAWDYRDRMSS